VYHLDELGRRARSRPERLGPNPVALASVPHLPESQESVAISKVQKSVASTFNLPLHQAILPAHSETPAHTLKDTFFHKTLKEGLQ
jgi:hypothetical protein